MRGDCDWTVRFSTPTHCKRNDELVGLRSLTAISNNSLQNSCSSTFQHAYFILSCLLAFVVTFIQYRICPSFRCEPFKRRVPRKSTLLGKRGYLNLLLLGPQPRELCSMSRNWLHCHFAAGSTISESSALDDSGNSLLAILPAKRRSLLSIRLLECGDYMFQSNCYLLLFSTNQLETRNRSRINPWDCGRVST